MKLNDPKNSLACMNLIRKFNQSYPQDYAEFSECGTYRYILRRKNPIPLRWIKPILFIMLNPSTADEMKNDPTIRRCIFFAGRSMASELIVVNLFALRSTDPKKLLKHKEPVGPLNDEKILSVAKTIGATGTIVAAWGAHPIAKERGEELLKKLSGYQIMCLGTTKNGSPRHPLYVKSKQPLEVYR